MHLFAVLLSVLIILPETSYAQEYTIEVPCDDAEYKPGVDVDGNEVIAADLSSEVKSSLYPLEVPIEIDALRLMDLTLAPALKEALDLRIKVAYVTVHEDGRVEYNGEDVSGSVSRGCLDVEEEAAIEEIVSKIVRVHGQEDEDNVVFPANIEPAAGEENSEEPTSQTTNE